MHDESVHDANSTLDVLLQEFPTYIISSVLVNIFEASAVESQESPFIVVGKTEYNKEKKLCFCLMGTLISLSAYPKGKTRRRTKKGIINSFFDNVFTFLKLK